MSIIPAITAFATVSHALVPSGRSMLVLKVKFSAKLLAVKRILHPVRIRTSVVRIRTRKINNLSRRNFGNPEAPRNLRTSVDVLIAKSEMLRDDLLTEFETRRQRYKRQPGGVWMSERNNASESNRNGTTPDKSRSDAALHPAWQAFVRYCQQMGHGEIERLKIQDGIPVLVEVSRQKIKFS